MSYDTCVTANNLPFNEIIFEYITQIHGAKMINQHFLTRVLLKKNEFDQ